jgi:hypothetical protein
MACLGGCGTWSGAGSVTSVTVWLWGPAGNWGYSRSAIVADFREAVDRWRKSALPLLLLLGELEELFRARRGRVRRVGAWLFDRREVGARPHSTHHGPVLLNLRGGR